MAKIDDGNRLLLVRNSSLRGYGYLDHVEKEILDFVGRRTSVLFVPYAVHDRRTYATNAIRRSPGGRVA